MSSGSRSELAKRPANAVDPHDEPSVEWGWHGSFPRATQIAGWFTAAVMFLMLIGNQIGHVEDIFLVITGTTLVIGLLIDIARRRRAWRR
ncbi:MAG TPA: DUF2631 domain-containing protein [Pseudonocardiaceae bacterium]|nr:DUF2631 domain-containing protein [Pseudonocardiaceae bacterium]